MSDGSRLSQDKKKGEKIIASNAIPPFPHERYDILLPKLFSPAVRKTYSSDREKLLKFEAEGLKVS